MFGDKWRFTLAGSLIVLDPSQFRHKLLVWLISPRVCRIKLHPSERVMFTIGNEWWIILRFPSRKRYIYCHNKESNCSKAWGIRSRLNGKSVIIVGYDKSGRDFLILRKHDRPFVWEHMNYTHSCNWSWVVIGHPMSVTFHNHVSQKTFFVNQHRQLRIRVNYSRIHISFISRVE